MNRVEFITDQTFEGDTLGIFIALDLESYAFEDFSFGTMAGAYGYHDDCPDEIANKIESIQLTSSEDYNVFPKGTLLNSVLLAQYEYEQAPRPLDRFIEEHKMRPAYHNPRTFILILTEKPENILIMPFTQPQETDQRDFHEETKLMGFELDLFTLL